MSNSAESELAKKIDDARTMLATELVEKMLMLAPVGLSSDKVVGFILNKEVALELTLVANVIANDPCKCVGRTKKPCKHAHAQAFIDRLHDWLIALEEMKTSRIIRPK